MKKVVVVIGSMFFIGLLGSLVVWANISIKNCNDVKIVNSDDNEKIETKDNTLLKNEQIFETEEIDTSDSSNIRIHPVTGEVRENDGSGESLMEDKRESQELAMQNTGVTDASNTETAISAIVQNDITKIIITNGNTGEQKEINEIEEVDNLLNQIKNLNIISCEKNNVQGYAYSLAMYQEKELVQIIYVSSGSIQIGGKIYTVDSAENIIDSVK